MVLCAECSSTETLNAEDKFFCDACSGLQEAQKRFKIKVLPPVLCLHLKRFKYIEQYDRCALCSAFSGSDAAVCMVSKMTGP